MNFKSSFKMARFPLMIAAGLVVSRIPSSSANDFVPKTNTISVSYDVGVLNCDASGNGGSFFYKNHAEGLLGYSFTMSADDEILLTPLTEPATGFYYEVDVQGDNILGGAEASDLQTRVFEELSNGAEVEVTGTPRGRAIGFLTTQTYLTCKAAASPI